MVWYILPEIHGVLATDNTDTQEGKWCQETCVQGWLLLEQLYQALVHVESAEYIHSRTASPLHRAPILGPGVQYDAGSRYEALQSCPGFHNSWLSCAARAAFHAGLGAFKEAIEDGPGIYNGNAKPGDPVAYIWEPSFPASGRDQAEPLSRLEPMRWVEICIGKIHPCWMQGIMLLWLLTLVL